MNLGAPVPTFWCEPTGRTRRSLRCYQATGEQGGCGGYCNSMVSLDEVDIEWDAREDGSRYHRGYSARDWPWDSFKTACDKCSSEMTEPTRQIFCDEVFEAKTGQRAGERFARRALPVGACWHADHYEGIAEWCGPDGLAVMCQTPDGEWHVDSVASNCTARDRPHKCWIRHGSPKTGYLHVDKDGPTCDAGAGSIWMSAPTGWHGFAYRGHLIDADGDWRAVVDRLLDPGNPISPAERSTPRPLADIRRLRQQTPRTAAEMRAKLRASR